jgi:multimeric flavodoxin WrbA
MPHILTINASPVTGSSTEILLSRVAEGIRSNCDDPVSETIVCLNDYQIKPCQACGESPEPDYCLYKDDIYPVIEMLVECDMVLFGSPIYFDTVSAQAKLFIDRCNCLQPANFENQSGHLFKRIIKKKRCGGITLVGGQRQKIEGARTVIAGFFKWVNIINCGMVSYESTGLVKGGASEDQNVLEKAFKLGRSIVEQQSLS